MWGAPRGVVLWTTDGLEDVRAAARHGTCPVLLPSAKALGAVRPGYCVSVSSGVERLLVLVLQACQLNKFRSPVQRRYVGRVVSPVLDYRGFDLGESLQFEGRHVLEVKRVLGDTYC